MTGSAPHLLSGNILLLLLLFLLLLLLHLPLLVRWGQGEEERVVHSLPEVGRERLMRCEVDEVS